MASDGQVLRATETQTIPRAFNTDIEDGGKVKNDMEAHSDISYRNLTSLKRKVLLNWISDSKKLDNARVDMFAEKNNYKLDTSTTNGGLLPVVHGNMKVKIVTFSGDAASTDRVCLEDRDLLFSDIRIYVKNLVTTQKLCYGNAQDNSFGKRKMMLRKLMYNPETAIHADMFGEDCFTTMLNSTLSQHWNATTKKLTYEFLLNPFVDGFLSEQFSQFDGIFNTGTIELEIEFVLNKGQDAFTYPATVTETDIEIDVTVEPVVEIWDFSRDHFLMSELMDVSQTQRVKRIHHKKYDSSGLSPYSFTEKGLPIQTLEAVIMCSTKDSVITDTSIHGRFDENFISADHATVQLEIDTVPVAWDRKVKTFNKLEMRQELHRFLGNNVSNKVKDIQFHDWTHNDSGGSDGKCFYLWDLSMFSNQISGLGSALPAKDVKFSITYSTPPGENVVYDIYYIYTDFVHVDNSAGTITMESENYEL